MKRLLALGLMALVFVSCGEKRSGNNVIETMQFGSYPLVLKKFSSGCEEKNFASTLFRLNLFLLGQVTTQEEDLAPVLHTNLLRDSRNKIISRSIYNRQEEWNGFSYSVLRAPQEIDLCENDYYENDTVEGAALSTAHYISKTNKKFLEANPQESLSPILLDISPVIKTVIEVTDHAGRIRNASYYEADNAFYDPGDKSIVFLPNSKEGVRYSFWRVPMVSSHEYGHHIFQALFGNQGGSQSASLCFDVQLAHDQEFKMATDNERKMTVDGVVGAFNEGFADLIAFYTLDESERDLTGIPCLETSRQVDQLIFADGTAKFMTEEILSAFFSSTRNPAPRTCTTPNFQSLHTIGAIFAHNAYQLMRHQNREMSLKTISHWIKEMGKLHPRNASLGAREYMRKAMLAFAQSVKSDQPRFCKNVERLYPGLAKDFPSCQ